MDDIQYSPIIKGEMSGEVPRRRRGVVSEENHENYVNSLQRQRDLGKVKVPKKKSKKKGIPKAIIIGGIVAVAAVSGSAYIQAKGTSQIVQTIEDSGCVEEHFSVIDSSNGKTITITDVNGNHSYVENRTQFIQEVYTDIVEGGFTYDQAAIYLSAMGVDEATFENSSIIGRMGAKLSAYADLTRADDVEKGASR